jgi:hypothetical protein
MNQLIQPGRSRILMMRVTCRLGRALARPNTGRPFQVGSREELDPTYKPHAPSVAPLRKHYAIPARRRGQALPTRTVRSTRGCPPYIQLDRDDAWIDGVSKLDNPALLFDATYVCANFLATRPRVMWPICSSALSISVSTSFEKRLSISEMTVSRLLCRARATTTGNPNLSR